MANRNWQNGGKLFIPQVKPILLNCSFTVTPTNGLGITGFSGPNFMNIFMHTSTTPAANNGVTNPNPANGTILVQLQDNYNRLLGFMNSIISPASGSDVKIDNSAMTAGVAYVITTLGNATAAKWLAIGVPAGVTPAVGVAFIALSNGGAGNTLTSRVQTAATSGAGISSLQLIGNPQLSIAPAPSSANGIGAQFILQCMAPTFTGESYTPAGTVAAPIFTGSALGTHTHAIAVATGTAGDAVTNNAGVLNSVGGQDLVTEATSGGTPAGTNSAPAFTGTAHTLAGTMGFAAAAPATGSIISLSLYLSDSSVTVNGQ